jgi:hypothetical protein
MASPPNQPAYRLTGPEFADLNSWSFINLYNKRRIKSKLIDLAKSVYASICRLLNAPPTEDQFYRAYSAALRWADVYTRRIIGRNHHLPPSVHGYFADLLAKYVLQQDWAIIRSVPCP